MSLLLPRRKLITAGLATAAGASGLAAAARLAVKYGLIPPDHSGPFGLGETLTYAGQRILMSGHSMAREFDRSQISKVIPVNGDPPATETYQRLLHGEFAEWRFAVDGLVDRPYAFSLAELKRYPARTQVTHQACEEGWSFIAECTGVPLSHVLDLVGVRPQAKYVVFFAMDNCWESLDMPEARHPQTLLAYGMNGRELPAAHGAPLRVRVPRQLGYKSKKFLYRMQVTDTLQGIRNGLGSSATESGYSWYAGI